MFWVLKRTMWCPSRFHFGATLILLFINDLPLYVDNVSADHYANDTSLYDIQASLEAIEVNLPRRIKPTPYMM